MLKLDDLRTAVADGSIDTVAVAFTDDEGRFRFDDVATKPGLVVRAWSNGEPGSRFEPQSWLPLCLPPSWRKLPRP